MVTRKIGKGSDKFDASKTQGMSHVDIDGKLYKLYIGSQDYATALREKKGSDYKIIPFNYYWVVKRDLKEEKTLKEAEANMKSKKVSADIKKGAKYIIGYMKKVTLKL